MAKTLAQLTPGLGGPGVPSGIDPSKVFLDEEDQTFIDRVVQQIEQEGRGDEGATPGLGGPGMPEIAPKGFIQRLASGIENVIPGLQAATRTPRKPTFPSDPTESYPKTAAKLVGNIPSSALQFAKGVANFLNPATTIERVTELGKELGEAREEMGSFGKVAKETVKELPKTMYKVLVPSFIKNLIANRPDESVRDLTNDPVGQILPLILIGREIARGRGKLEQFDADISTIARPVIKGVSAPFKLASRVAGKVGEAVFGTTTGVGRTATQKAFEGSPEFTEAMRGKSDPRGIVENLAESVGRIKEVRRGDYVSKLEQIKASKQTLDISSLQKELATQLKNFNVRVKTDGTLDFSRSSIANKGEAVSDITNVYETVKSWGSQAGDRTPIGVDSLKQQLGDLYSPTGNARAFVQAMYNKTNNILKDSVPGYKAMTSEYETTSGLLNDIKGALGTGGGKVSIDAIFRKLTAAMRQDKGFGKQILGEIETKTGSDVMAQMSGQMMQSIRPVGLVGQGLSLIQIASLLKGLVNPSVFMGLASTSPRIVGEFLRTAGMASSKITAITNALATIKATNIPLIPPNYEIEK